MSRPDQRQQHPTWLARARAQGMRPILVIVVLLAAIGARVVFWAATERVWEDALITVRHAENAVAGQGLTHHPAQGRVHGFTSPISVLIPLGGEATLGPGRGLVLMQASSLLAAALTLILGARLAAHPRLNLGLPGTCLFLGYLAFEHHAIAFGMAGMETQWIVAITLLVLLTHLEERPVGLGLACGLALWGRPDGVILVAVVLGGLLLQRRGRDALRTAALCALLIAPWVVFTTFYYGSPIPNTILAKGSAWSRTFLEAPTWAAFLRHWGAEMMTRVNHLRLWLAPSFGGLGTGTVNLLRGSRVIQAAFLALALAGVWRVRRDPLTRVVALYAAAFAAYLLIFVPVVAGWYLPPWLAVIALLAGSGVTAIEGPPARWPRPGLRPALAFTLAIGLLAPWIAVLPRTFAAERLIQRCFEDGVRTTTGKRLAALAAPDDWIACECLGYLGYFSNRPILDYPGLCSPRSVRALLRLPQPQRSLTALIDLQRPQWLALRPEELERLAREFPAARAEYLERERVTAPAACSRRLATLLGLRPDTPLGDREFLLMQHGRSHP